MGEVINLRERIARREAEKQAAEKKVVWMPEWRKRLVAKDYTPYPGGAA